MRRVAERCYLPANRLLHDLILRHNGAFKVAFSISGVAIEQFERYVPEVIDSFKALAATGCVEFLAETYSHSLASLASTTEFKKQVKLHADLTKRLFGVKPTVFRNTELIYSDAIGATVSEMGYHVMLTEGAKHILGWKSPDFVYANAVNPRLKLLLRNFNLSDDIAFRFSDKGWNGWPLTADKFADWAVTTLEKGDVLNLFMDYETFGEHQGAECGIFEFMRAMTDAVAADKELEFVTPERAAARLKSVGDLSVPQPISWADEERDTSAWLGNELQQDAFQKLYGLQEKLSLLDDSTLWNDYGRLQESDHLYYMCTKFFSDGEVHKRFNPYDTPYEAFINYMNVLSDFIIRVNNAIAEKQ